MTRLQTWLAALVLIATCASVHAETPLIASPDGRFVFRFLAEKDSDQVDYTTFVVEEKKTRRVVLRAPEDAINSFTEGSRVVFSPDSSHLGLNFQAGGRYQVTLIYRWSGKQFVKIAEPEAALTKHLEASKAAQLKAERIPKDIYLRRIWDTWETERWIDGRTAVIRGSSMRTFILEGDEEPQGLTADIRFTVRIEKNGKMKLLKREEIANETAENAQPE